jgi:hypothetical protein
MPPPPDPEMRRASSGKPAPKSEFLGSLGSTESHTAADRDNQQPIIERDDGLYQIGLQDDAPGPFRTRHFAETIAEGLAR